MKRIVTGLAVWALTMGIFATTPAWADHHEAVNINTADAAILQTLPNIGPAKADAILKHRQQNGPFSAAEDLKNVKGIGDVTFEKLEDKITVGETNSAGNSPPE